MRRSIVLVAQSCPALCNLMDCSPPGPSVHGILQARILEWVAIPFSGALSWPKDRSWVSCTASRFFTIWATWGAHVFQSLSCVRLFAIPWTAARQASLSFSISWSLRKLLSIELVMSSKHSSSVIPFSSCPQSFPASESLPIGWLFTSGGQSIGASAGHNSCCIGQRLCAIHVLEFFIARGWAHQADPFYNACHFQIHDLLL